SARTYRRTRTDCTSAAPRRTCGTAPRRRPSRGRGRARRSACSGRRPPSPGRRRVRAVPPAAAAARPGVARRIRRRSPGSRGAGISGRRSSEDRILARGRIMEPAMADDSDRALELWREGTEVLLQGRVDDAIALFTRSLEASPTAEAYTFRGWAYSFGGKLE